MGFQLDFWDYATFLSLFVLTVAGLGLAVFILGLPGRNAIARNHPEAEAVYLMGWVGFLAVVRRHKDIFRTVHAAMQFRHAVETSFHRPLPGADWGGSGHTRSPLISIADGQVFDRFEQIRPEGIMWGMA